MSNIIDKIQLSGITYDIGGQGGSGVSVVEVTQAEYDALPSSAKTDTSKMYVITDAQAGDLTNYYTKTETNTLLGGKADTATTYTKTETNTLLGGKADTATTYTKTEVDTLLGGKADTATTYTKTEVDNAITAATSTKQDQLVSSVNIKTINNESILGSGNIDIQGGGGGGKAVTGGTNISITTGATADTINCTLPISADTDGSVNEFLVGNNNTIGSDTNKNIVIGDNNTTFGQGGNRYYSGATIIGYNNNVGCVGMQNDNNDWSFVIGRRNKVNGGNTYILGVDNNFYDADSYTYKKNYSYVIGRGNTSSLPNDGNNIFVFGAYNKITKSDEFALGEYNASSNDGTTSGNTFFAIGNGTSTNARHNAFEIRQNGDIYITSGGTDILLQDNLGGGGSSYSAGTGIDITNNVISVTGMVATSSIATAVTSSSTDSEVPSAKCLYDTIGNIETLLSQI